MMNVFSCLHGRVSRFLLVPAVVCAGCGIPLLPGHDSYGSIPPSNNQVAETVIERALQNLDIPPGRGMEVLYTVEGNGEVTELVDVIAPEFLLDRGFRITEKDDTVPEIRFGVDTLYVSLSVEHPPHAGKRIVRTAEARIFAMLLEKDGTRKVFNGCGIFQDYFPFSMLDTIGMDEPYIIQSNRFVSILKPVIFGLAVTTLAWFLYSYRG